MYHSWIDCGNKEISLQMCVFIEIKNKKDTIDPNPKTNVYGLKPLYSLINQFENSLYIHSSKIK